MIRRGRLVLTLGLALYGIPCLMRPGDGRLLDGVDLAIHETGHLVFAPFGEFVGFLGGTLGQLLMPAIFIAYFWRQRDRHAASIALWWVAQNLWNISVYVADARTEELPLVGGGEHDWAYLLGRLGWLSHDAQLSRAIWLIGVALYVVAVIGGVRAAARPETAEGSDAPVDRPAGIRSVRTSA
jgi:hypothetical protein